MSCRRVGRVSREVGSVRWIGSCKQDSFHRPFGTSGPPVQIPIFVISLNRTEAGHASRIRKRLPDPAGGSGRPGSDPGLAKTRVPQRSLFLRRLRDAARDRAWERAWCARSRPFSPRRCGGNYSPALKAKAISGCTAQPIRAAFAEPCCRVHRDIVRTEALRHHQSNWMALHRHSLVPLIGLSYSCRFSRRYYDHFYWLLFPAVFPGHKRTGRAIFLTGWFRPPGNR